MNLLTLFGLSKSELPRPSPEQIRKSRKLLAKFDIECEERTRRRIPTREQLTRPIDI